jgi:hypothetical protein
MGLAERRIIKDFQDNQYGGFVRAIQEAGGNQIEVDVRWDEIAKDGQSQLFLDAWPKLYFTPVIEALRSIGRDDLGKEALQAGFKRVEIHNLGGHYSPESAIAFADGTLRIDHDLVNVDDVEARTRHIIQIVEAAL